MNYIDKAVIPILKINFKIKGSQELCMDISVAESVIHQGLACVDFIKEFLNSKDYKKHLEPLLLVVKHVLYLSGMNDPFKHGLSSYGLFLLLLAFLQSF